MNGVAGPLTGPVAEQAARSAIGPVTPARRVRHEVRDGLAVMAFSAATSVGLAAMLLLLTGLGK
jgi:hypothetical protein